MPYKIYKTLLMKLFFPASSKLASECFLENLNRYGDFRLEPEKYNLYTGLYAMSKTIEALLQHVHKVEMQLDSILTPYQRR